MSIPVIDTLSPLGNFPIVDSSNVQYGNQRLNNVVIPTKTSQITNDSGFLTQHQSLEEYAKKSEIPKKVSNLQNDAGYITAEDIPASNYVTPEMFGAVGDGITDDSDAFLEALSHKYVLLTSSYYVGEITLEENNIIVASTSVENTIKGSIIIKGMNSIFSNFTFDGNNEAYAVKLTYDQQLSQYDCSFRFENIRVKNATKGVDITSSARNVVFKGCSFYSCTTYCVYDVGTDNHYTDCAFFNSQTGLFVYNNSLITASTFYDLGTGINVNHDYNGISNCDFQQSNVAIYCTGSNNNITNIAIENMSLTESKSGIGIYLYNAGYNNIIGAINADPGRIHGGLDVAVRILGANSVGNNVILAISGSFTNDIPDAVTTSNHIILNGTEFKRPVVIATLKSSSETTPYTKTGKETEFMMCAIGCSDGLGSFMYVKPNINLTYRVQITADYYLEVTVNSTSIYVNKSSGIVSVKLYNVY